PGHPDERRGHRVREEVRQAGEPRAPGHLQPAQQAVLRVLRQLGARPAPLPEGLVGGRRGQARYLGEGPGRRQEDQGQARRPRRLRAGPGAGHEHDGPGAPVVVRGRGAGRGRQRGHQLQGHRRGPQADDGAVQGVRDRRGLHLGPLVQQPVLRLRQGLHHPERHLGHPHRREAGPRRGQGERAGAAGGRPQDPARLRAPAALLRRLEVRREPRDGQEVPGRSHRRLQRRLPGQRVLQLPLVLQVGDRPQGEAGRRQGRPPALRLPGRRREVERVPRVPRLHNGGDRRGVQHLRPPEHVRPRGQGGAEPRGLGQAGRGGDEANLREMEQVSGLATRPVTAAHEAPPGGASLRRRPRPALLDRESFLGPLMILPAVLYVVALVGLPFILALFLSVSNAKIGRPTYPFIGFENFTGAIQSPAFRRSLANTFVFTIVSQVLVLTLAKILATCLQQPFHGKSVIRFLILLPWVAPISLGTIGWKWMLDSLYSPVNWVLRAVHVIGPNDWPMWFGERGLAMASVIGVHVWRLLPSATVIILAGLTSIPKEVTEAADVDGAGFWRREVYIVLPLLRPIMTVAGLFGIIFAFTDMTVIYVLTRGG